MKKEMVKLFIYLRNASTSFLHSKKCFRQNVVIRQRKPFELQKVLNITQTTR